MTTVRDTTMKAGLRYGYITNGLADHRLDDALAFLADCGYDGVGLTLDHHHLDPFGRDVGAQVDAISRRLQDLGLAVVIETGARFLLDPRRKHEPTLLSEGRELRISLLRRAIAIAADIGAPVVSFWSGVVPAGLDPDEAWNRLATGCDEVIIEAQVRGVTLGLEPEPGMLVERIDDWERLAAHLGQPGGLGLTLDIGHCQCLETEPIDECVRRVGSERLVHVQIEDMRRGVHEHLDFGDGEIDFPPVLSALAEIGYRGLVCVELSRHSHTAHTTVPRAITFLRQAERKEVMA
jgi:L-ribulose-5-phosphate 3-epimerase